jgi:hypothetical protein
MACKPCRDRREKAFKVDREVHIKVMGHSSKKATRAEVPPYSTQFESALEVLDRMRVDGYRWLIVSSEQGYFIRNLVNVTHDQDQDEKRYTADRPIPSSQGIAQRLTELPLLICRAALEETERKICLNEIEKEAERR